MSLFSFDDDNLVQKISPQKEQKIVIKKPKIGIGCALAVETSARQDTAFKSVQVALPTRFNVLLTYLVPQSALEGDLVYVPFGKKMIWGILWQDISALDQTKDKFSELGGKKFDLKQSTYIHPFIKISKEMRTFLKTVSTYNVVPLGHVIKMTLSDTDFALYAFYHINMSKNEGKNDPFHGDNPTINRSLLGWRLYKGVQMKTVLNWIEKKWLIPATDKEKNQAIPIDLDPSEQCVPSPHHLTLTLEQNQALQAMIDQSQHHLTLVLEGVTGSGKTEVLLALCQTLWQQKKQVLILLPEIMLSAQWEKRIARYFNVNCCLWHSGLTEATKSINLQNIVSGHCDVIIGARSALFLPYAHLGLIIVDEEHESGYKQNEGILYHGRDMAVLRGQAEKITVILASATPSLESCYHVSQGRYGLIRLHNRYGNAQLPSFSLIDMRSHPPKDKAWIGPELRQIITDTLSRKEQTLLFLNRRGYACIYTCFKCHYRASCPDCSVWMSVHLKPPKLICHYCGHWTLIPVACPECASDQAMAMMGPGIERIQEEVMGIFPQARTALLSSDHLSSTQSMQGVLKLILSREVDILIGTQLVAKGYHFPHLTSIGIIDADFALHDMDFRSGERLFQLLYQVAGRAGRAHLPGHAYLQTLQPTYPLFRHLQSYNWQHFVKEELENRHRCLMPPFIRMAALTLSDRCEWRVQEAAMQLQKTCVQPEGVINILGPAPAPLSPLRGYHRWRFIIKSSRSYPLHKFLAQWISDAQIPKTVRLDVDRDPYSFL